LKEKGQPELTPILTALLAGALVRAPAPSDRPPVGSRWPYWVQTAMPLIVLAARLTGQRLTRNAPPGLAVVCQFR
jgi:hypothetical protein